VLLPGSDYDQASEYDLYDSYDDYDDYDDYDGYDDYDDQVEDDNDNRAANLVWHAMHTIRGHQRMWLDSIVQLSRPVAWLNRLRK
jgi:hypothetical protein